MGLLLLLVPRGHPPPRPQPQDLFRPLGGFVYTRELQALVPQVTIPAGLQLQSNPALPGPVASPAHLASQPLGPQNTSVAILLVAQII